MWKLLNFGIMLDPSFKVIPEGYDHLMIYKGN